MEFSGQLARKRKARGLSQPDPAGSIKESGGSPLLSPPFSCLLYAPPKSIRSTP